MAKTKGKITAVTPQFTRTPGATGPAAPPRDAAEWEALRTLTKNGLKALGLRESERVANKTLMLLPGEWFAHIPEGYSVVTINGRIKLFTRAYESADIRMGYLAYGILV